MTAEYEFTNDDVDSPALAAIIAPRRALVGLTDVEESVRFARRQDEKAVA